MNGRDLESSELGLPGENVETPIAIRAPRVKKDVWLAAAAVVHPSTQTLIAVNANGPSTKDKRRQTFDIIFMACIIRGSIWHAKLQKQ